MWPSGKLRLELVILSHSGQIPSRSSCILISSFILGTEQLEPQVLLKNFPFRKKPRTVKLSTFDKFTLYNSILFLFFFSLKMPRERNTLAPLQSQDMRGSSFSA